MRTHAWVTSSSYENPDDTIDKLHAANISVAVLMLNDYYGTSHRAAEDFRTFDVDKIERMAEACHAAGVKVHAMTWVMPHQCFVDGMLEQLPPLLESIGCEVLHLDAEEPWTQATGSFSYASAAEQIAVVFPRLALCGIGSSPSELTELAKRCALFIPQAYATKSSQATPGGVVPYSLDCWRADFGEPLEGWVMGLAGYKQADDAVSTMQPPIDDCVSAGITDVCYWTLRSIHEDPDVVAFVAGLAEPVDPPASARAIGPIFPPTDLAGSGPYSLEVARVQGLLLALDQGPDGLVDPATGRPDGLRGPKTRAAYQAATGLESTLVDWVVLLSAR